MPSQDIPIAVTGVGVVSSAGVGPETLHAALRRGISFVRRISDANGEDVCTVGAPASAFDVRDYLDRKQSRRLDRAAQLFVSSSMQAVEDCSFFKDAFDHARIGVFEGTALGGLGRALEEHEGFLARGARGVSPTAVTAMTGVGAGMVSLLYGIHGPVVTLSGGCVSSACAISAAVDHLQLGRLDVALAGGAESPLHPALVALCYRAGMLATGKGKVEQACRPFDAKRGGTVLAEAGACLVLERLPDAMRRGARVYAQICGISMTTDAYHLTAPSKNGTQRGRVLSQAMEDAKITPDDVDYISAHGTATRLNDPAETQAIKGAFGKHAYTVPVVSIKSMLGHPLGACTALEVVATIVAMQHRFIPPTINLSTPDPECDLDYVPNEARPGVIRRALITNASFCGKNTAIVLQAGGGGNRGAVTR